MKIQTILLRVAGCICFLFALFHLAFQKLFNWNETLSCLSQSNRAIMLTYHYISILILGFMSFVLLFQAKLLMGSNIRYAVLTFFSIFYIIRITTEFTLFGFSQASPVILVMCVSPVILFLIPLLLKKRL